MCPTQRRASMGSILGAGQHSMQVRPQPGHCSALTLNVQCSDSQAAKASMQQGKPSCNARCCTPNEQCCVGQLRLDGLLAFLTCLWQVISREAGRVLPEALMCSSQQQLNTPSSHITLEGMLTTPINTGTTRVQLRKCSTSHVMTQQACIGAVPDKLTATADK